MPAAPLAAHPALKAHSSCLHCGEEAHGTAYCCTGCEAAHQVIAGMGLGEYYARRTLDPSVRAMRPLDDGLADPERFVQPLAGDACRLRLGLDGLQCGACVWLIESVLAQEPGLDLGRVNLTTWTGSALLAGGNAASMVGS